MAFDYLKPKPATRITTAWGSALIDVLNLLYGWLTDGSRDINVNDVFANYGFFSSNLFVSDKPVLKDGDPITVYDIADYAREKITYAIDATRISKLANVYMDTYGNVGVAIYDDKVGLAKDATLNTVSQKLDPLAKDATLNTISQKLDRPIIIYDVTDYVRDKVTAAIDKAAISKLANVYIDVYGNVGTAIYDDKVGLAKDATLNTILQKLGEPITVYDILDYARDKIAAAIDKAAISKLASIYLDEYGNVGAAIYDDRVGLAKDATVTGVSQKLDKLDELGRLELVAYTTTPLAANGEWVSSVDSSVYTRFICGSVYADQAGTLYVEQSPDNSNWDVVDTFTVSGGSGVKFSVEKVAPYARVRYVNGSTDQTVFRLYVYRRLRV